MVTDNEFLKAALEYAERGARVFPLKPKSKIPLTSDGFKSASNAPAQIQQWWTQWPNANIGLATGERSGVWVLDIDGFKGEASLRALEDKHGALPQTVEAITGGGGRHLFFDLTNTLNLLNSAGKVGEKIDVRANGGYVVAPPSIHPSGRRYEWSVDSAADFVTAPEWLLRLVTNKPKSKSGHPSMDWVSMLEDVAEGQRNDTLARLTGKLLGHRLDPKFAFYLLLCWNDARCKPPMSQDEMFQTFSSIAQAEVNKRSAV